MGPKVFISYRRADTGDIAPKVADRLRSDLGGSMVYRDKDDLIGGQLWEPTLESALEESDAAVFLIGPDWTGEPGDDSRRIEEEGDPVAQEVRTALSSADAWPVPVFVDRSSPPDEEELPSDVYQLFKHHAVKSTRKGLLSRSSKDYQGVLVGIWESIRQGTPQGVLIIGDDQALADVDELIEELKAKRQIDARRLSQVAAGAYVVSPRRLRRATKKWPDVIVVVGEDEPSETTKSRLQVLRSIPSIRNMTIAGVGGAGVVAGFLGAQVVAGQAAVTATAGTAEVAASLPGAGGPLTAIGSAWTEAALGIKVAAVAGTLAVTAIGVTTVVNNGSSYVELGVVDAAPVPGSGSVTPAAVDGFGFTPTTEQVFVEVAEMSGDGSILCVEWAVSPPGAVDPESGTTACGGDSPGTFEVVPGTDYVLTVINGEDYKIDYTLQIWPVPEQETVELGVVDAAPVPGSGSVTPAAVDGFGFTPTTEQVFVEVAEMSGDGSILCVEWAVSPPGAVDPESGTTACGGDSPGTFEVVPGTDYVLTVINGEDYKIDYTLQIWPVPEQETVELGVVDAAPVPGSGSVTPAAVDGFGFTPTTEQVFVEVAEMSGDGSILCVEWAVSPPGAVDPESGTTACGGDSPGTFEVVPGTDYVLTVINGEDYKIDYTLQICSGDSCP